MTLDVLEAMLLSVIYLLTIPVAALRSITGKQLVNQIRLLLPFGLLAALMRAALDFRMGYLDKTIASLESMIGTAEEAFDEDEIVPVHAGRALIDLYSFLTLVHLRSGQIEEAAHALVRANRSLGVQKLSAVKDMDAKTAQIVKAGIAAGKLMEDGSIASFLFPNPRPATSPSSNPFRAEFPPKTGGRAKVKGAKIIPFPSVRR